MNNFGIVQAGLGGVMGAPLGMPITSEAYNPALMFRSPSPPIDKGPEIPGEDLPRAVNYMADYGGCSWYRCMAPNLMINLYGKGVIMESTKMILDSKFYQGLKSVKIQRQATPIQRDFVRALKDLSQREGFKIIYEIDDVVFRECIPDYNRNKDAFVSDEVHGSIIDILEMCDEITVTCDHMKELFKSKTRNQNVTVIPNYLLRWWFDRYYNHNNLIKEYEKNKKRPVVSIFASGTHVDVMNRVNQRDDFESIVQAVIRTRKDIDWRFYGSHPLPLLPFIRSGEIKFTDWVQLPDFPRVMAQSGTQLTFASLQDNDFNRSKSNIKLIEAGAMGIPCVCPDMCTYQDALLKYKTGDELIDQIKYALKDQNTYSDLCKKSREYTESFWLEDEPNLGQHVEAYFTPYGSEARKFLPRTNPFD